MNKKTTSLLKQLTVLTLSDELQWHITPMPLIIPFDNKKENLQFEASTHFYNEKRKRCQIDIRFQGLFIDNTFQKNTKSSALLKELIRLLKLKTAKIMWNQLYGEAVS